MVNKSAIYSFPESNTHSKCSWPLCSVATGLLRVGKCCKYLQGPASSTVTNHLHSRPWEQGLCFDTSFALSNEGCKASPRVFPCSPHCELPTSSILDIVPLELLVRSASQPFTLAYQNNPVQLYDSVFQASAQIQHHVFYLSTRQEHQTLPLPC